MVSLIETRLKAIENRLEALEEATDAQHRKMARRLLASASRHPSVQAIDTGNVSYKLLERLGKKDLPDDAA